MNDIFAHFCNNTYIFLVFLIISSTGKRLRSRREAQTFLETYEGGKYRNDRSIKLGFSQPEWNAKRLSGNPGVKMQMKEWLKKHGARIITRDGKTDPIAKAIQKAKERKHEKNQRRKQEKATGLTLTEGKPTAKLPVLTSDKLTTETSDADAELSRKAENAVKSDAALGENIVDFPLTVSDAHEQDKEEDAAEKEDVPRSSSSSRNAEETFIQRDIASAAGTEKVEKTKEDMTRDEQTSTMDKIAATEKAEKPKETTQVEKRKEDMTKAERKE